jgi:hypothetical protein
VGGDVDGQWKHDLAPLDTRLSQPGTTRTGAPKYNLTGAAAALGGGRAASGGSISIKGAGSASQNTLEIRGLVGGTTAEDVKVLSPSPSPHARC